MDMNQIMKQAQQMQKKMEEVQQKLGEIEVTGSAGGGMVSVTLNGKGEARKVTIDDSLIKADEKDVLEDLIVAGFNDAKTKNEKTIADEMTKVTSGMGLPPGLNLPTGL